MGLGTCLVGLLPSFAQIGILAPILLTLCRVEAMAGKYLVELVADHPAGAPAPPNPRMPGWNTRAFAPR
jgi:hypothetical protein